MGPTPDEVVRELQHLTAVLDAQVRAARDSGDATRLFEPETAAVARRVAELSTHHETDAVHHARAQYQLGWWHHLRHDALSDAADRSAEFSRAAFALLLAREAYGGRMPDEALPTTIRLCLNGDRAAVRSDVWQAWMGALDQFLDAVASSREDATALERLLGVRRERYASAIPGPEAFARAIDLAQVERRLGLRRRDVDLLNESARLLRGLLETCVDDLDCAVVQVGLANTLRETFDVTGDAGVLDEAWRHAISAADNFDGDLERSWVTASTVAYVGLALFKSTRDLRVLEHARDAAGAAYNAGTAPSGWQQSVLAVNLVHLLHWAFTVTGDRVQIDRAVAAAEGAVKHALGTIYLSNASAALASALEARWAAFGDETDLDVAVHHGERAVDFAPYGHPRATCAGNLAHMLAVRGTALDRVADLDRAVELAESSVNDIDVASPDYARSLEIASSCRVRRGLATGDVHDLTVGLRHALAGVEATGALDPERARRHAHVSHVLQYLVVDHRRADLAELWVEHARLAVACCSVLAAERPGYLIALGHALEVQTGDDIGSTGASEALGYYRAAARDEAGDHVFRFDAATREGSLADLRGERILALEAYRTAADLLSELAWRGVPYRRRVRALAGNTWVVSVAAERALELGRLEDAVLTLERGRTQLWNQDAELDADIGALVGVAPDLATEVADLRQELTAMERTFASSPVASEDAPPGDALGAARRSVVGRWRDLLERVRQVPDFGDFLQPPSFDRLMADVEDRRVVHLFPGRSSGHALIVSAEGVRSVELPGATVEVVQDIAEACVIAANHLTSGRPAAVVTASAGIDEVLDWCWRAVAQPVLDELDWRPGVGEDVLPMRRLWWCPTGPFALLPLHAARAGGSHEPGTLDGCVSSYTPSIGALGRAARRAANAPRPEALTLVGVPDVLGEDPLPFVMDELAAVRRLVTVSQEVPGAAARRDVVLDAVARASALHMACHARGDQGDRPAAVLAVDGPLDLPALRASRSAAGAWAYVSACSSAAVAPALADEQLTLAAGFQAVGYAHVIGTLWSISDQLAVAFADEIYRRVYRDGHLVVDDSAWALNSATRRVRDQYPTYSALWASYIHVGP